MTAQSIPTPQIDLRMVLSYMRSGGDTSAEAYAREAIELVRRAADCKIVWQRAEVFFPETGVSLGDWTIQSASLRKHLDGCREAVLFGATAGIGVDRLITASASRSAALSLAVDAAGGVLVEAVCDALEEMIGKARRFRYSPGYGDFDIGEQKKMASLLQLQKTIGVTLTEGMMLRPSKSVTAVIGLL